MLTISVASLLPGHFVIQPGTSRGGFLTRPLHSFGSPEVPLPNFEDAKLYRAWTSDPLLLERLFAFPGIRPALTAAFAGESGPFGSAPATFSLRKGKMQFRRMVAKPSGWRFGRICEDITEHTHLLPAGADRESPTPQHSLVALLRLKETGPT